MIEKHQQLHVRILPLPISNISFLIKSISKKGVQLSIKEQFVVLHSRRVIAIVSLFKPTEKQN